MKTVRRAAPAKVNLFLEVTGKRPNGYHELATLFAKINLKDEVTVSAEEAEETAVTLRITGPLASELSADQRNLASRAAVAFFERFALKARCEIKLEKHIPMGAGLGGGSSDAAAVLWALCEIFNKPRAEVLDIAAKLGADVPVFLYEETFLKGEGIGEILTPIIAPGPLPWLVLVYPDTAVPTKDVFARLRLPAPSESLTTVSNLDKLIKYILDGSSFLTWKKLLFNRLEECVYPYFVSVRNVKDDFVALDAQMTLMSGSGSTVFALAQEKQQAEVLAKRVEKTGRTVFLTTFRRHREDEDN